MKLTPVARERARALLCSLGGHIRDSVVATHRADTKGEMASLAEVTAADAIYRIDKVSHGAVIDWLGTHWPEEWPLELVMEGLEGQPCTFPTRTPVERTELRCVVDPIDGTRSLMYDKRSAWALVALAPQRGAATRLGDVVAAAMTEIPTIKQWRADQLSAVRGSGLVAESLAIDSGQSAPLTVQPSRATDFRHGFASISRFFPEGKALLAQLEEELWDELYGIGGTSYPLVFDDQYISTGGQIYELAVGHDRMLGDLRPLVFDKLGLVGAHTCHPYDICTALVLIEAGGIVEAPDGSQLDVPLDTTSPVAWMGYANSTLADQVRPILKRLLDKHCGTGA